MSYDVFVFFSEHERTLLEASRLTESIIGIQIPTGDNPATYVLDVFLRLQHRYDGLVDREGLPFHDFCYQLEMTCASHGGHLIHQIGLYLATEYSRRLGERSMITLAGIELLGAVFEKGRIVVDHMSQHENAHHPRPWKYLP